MTTSPNRTIPNMSLNFNVEEGMVLQSIHCGDFKVLKIFGWDKVLIQFINTGYQTLAQKSHIKSGSVRDLLHPSRFGIGYLGEGKYKFCEDGVPTQTTVIWKSMLERCYCPKFQSKFPTYVGCSVAEEWHNFQNFAAWVENNYPNDGQVYQLDKDIKVKGNRVYSPSTCTFLTRQQNMEEALAKHYIFVCPEGNVVEIYNIRDFCKDKNLTRENMGKVHRGERKSHKGWTKYIS